MVIKFLRFLKFFASRKFFDLVRELCWIYRAILLSKKFHIRQIEISSDLGINITNPSIIYMDGQWIVSAREPNYKISPIRRHYIVDGGSNNLNSRTWILNYSGDFRSREKATALSDKSARDQVDVAKNGLEDARLIVWNDQIWGLWTASHITDEGNRNTMVLGLIDGDTIKSPIVLHSPHRATQEKNWMPFVKEGEIFFLYNLERMEIYTLQHQNLVLVNRLASPIDALKGHSGSSQLVPWGEDWLCVSHFAARLGYRLFRIYPPHYIHKFVIISRDFKIRAISRDFFFLRRGLEFCAGLAVAGDRIVLSFGVDDRSAKIVELTSQQVQDCFGV